jgi:nitrate reductase NapE component
MQRLADAGKLHDMRSRSEVVAFVIMAVAFIVAPMFVYPVFLM